MRSLWIDDMVTGRGRQQCQERSDIPFPSIDFLVCTNLDQENIVLLLARVLNEIKDDAEIISNAAAPRTREFTFWVANGAANGFSWRSLSVAAISFFNVGCFLIARSKARMNVLPQMSVLIPQALS